MRWRLDDPAQGQQPTDVSDKFGKGASALIIPQQSPFQIREQDRKTRLLEGIFSLAGSGAMLVVCLC